jgi:hypothetical protein
VCGQHHAPAAFTPKKDPVPIVQEAGWAPEPVWIGAENLAPPGFDPRTFQAVASRYTDYAIPALLYLQLTFPILTLFDIFPQYATVSSLLLRLPLWLKIFLSVGLPFYETHIAILSNLKARFTI